MPAPPSTREEGEAEERRALPARARLGRASELGEVALEAIGTAPERRYRQGVAALALTGVLARLVIIAARSSGGFNLRLYWYFSHLAAHGHNPYQAPANGPVTPVDANNPPLEMLLFAAVLRLHDSPTTLRLAIALAEGALVLAIGWWYPRDRGWRAMLCLFLALNPFVLLVWTAFTSDKVLVVGLLAAVLAALASGNLARAWLWTALLAALKWVGLFYAPALALHTLREGLSRRLAATLALCALLFVALAAPWFPSSLEAWGGRNSRLTMRPTHAALTELLVRVHLYSASLVRPFIVIAIVAVLVLQWRRLLSTAEAIVLCVVASFIALPDHGVDRILMLTLALLLVIEMPTRRWLVLWGVSLLEALAFVIQQVGPTGAQGVIGNSESLGQVLLMNPLLLLCLYWLIRDRVRGLPRPGEGVPAPPPLAAAAVGATLQ